MILELILAGAMLVAVPSSNEQLTPPTLPPEVTRELALENRFRVMDGEIRLEPTLYQLCGLSEEDFELLAAILNAEDGADSFDNQVAIACVIFNRVESPEFNDTVRTVIEEHGQFSTSNHNGGAINWDGSVAYADESCRLAVYEAYMERPIPKSVLSFRAGHFFENLEPYAKIGDNYFSYG